MNSTRENGRGGSSNRWQWIVFVLAFASFLALMILGGFFRSDEPSIAETRADFRLRYRYDTLRDFDGVTYKARKNLTTILLIGVDKHIEESAATYTYGGGQADFLRLIVIDPAQMRVTQIQIDRDTISPILILGPTGDALGYDDYQLCLAHAFGDGKEQSCQLQMDAVSKFLLDTEIDFYMSLNLDGISVLNDQLGGVKVTLDTDLSDLDPAMTEGATITLQGEQAELFVRSRMLVDDGTNEARMKRQQQYIAKLSAKLNQRINADKNFVGELYDALGEYLLTDLSRGQMINEAWSARRYARDDVKQIAGEHVKGKTGFTEFYADPASVEELVRDVFYEKIE